MSQAIQDLQAALQRGMSDRPKVGGFPFLADTLRRAGVTRNLWVLPACQSTYVTRAGQVVMQGTPLIGGMADVAPFDEKALIRALRADQAGESSFPQFLLGAWNAGVVRYDADFVARQVSYFGSLGEVYVEEYPALQGV